MFTFSGQANFWLGDIPSGKNYDLYLYNASGTVIASSTSNNSSLPQEYIGHFTVSANTWYYIKVVGCNCYDATANYQLRVREVEQFEAEVNNTRATANQINDNETIYGKIQASGDEDYYKVRFNFSGEANFWLGDIPYGKDFELHLYNASGRELASSTSNNTSSQQEFIGSQFVTANSWYYIKVSGYNCYDTTNYYQIRARCYPVKEVTLRYDPSCTYTVLQMHSAFADATAAIATEFGVKFKIKYTYYTTALNGSSCPNSSNNQCCNDNCGADINCDDDHHKSADRLLDVYPSTTSSMYVCRIVGHRLCFYDIEKVDHYAVYGLGDPNGEDTIVSTYSDNLKRTIQHELSHNLGASHKNCLGRDCVLVKVMNSWCDNCKSAIGESS